MNTQQHVEGLADTKLAEAETQSDVPAGNEQRSSQQAQRPGGQTSDGQGRTEDVLTQTGRQGNHPVDPATPRGSGNGSAYCSNLTKGEAERYQVIGEYARGGLGRVIKARDDRLGRVVAIKELLKTTRFAESLFMREALITARLQHPGIVPVHEAGRWPSGEPFYVMKLVSGRSLQELIREASNLPQRLALLPNVLAVVETVAYAHSQRVLHRDIKPANIIIGDFGETVVVDWGLARDGKQPLPIIQSLHDVAESSGRSGSGSAGSGSSGSGRGPAVTAQTGDSDSRFPGSSDSSWLISGNYSVSGKVIGTPAYMSPEQASGKDVDERADVYALGALLYEVLAGEQPYPGKRLQVVLDRVLAGPPTSLTERAKDIPLELVTIVEKAMARDPAERYASAKELAEDLKRYQTGKLVSAHEYTTWSLIRRWLWRHRSPVLVALTAFFLLAVMGALSVSRVIDERNEAQRQREQARVAQKKSEQRKNELLVLQAEASLDSDPTATVAWLKQTPLGGIAFRQARRLFDEAVARGVARHVIEHDDAVFAVNFVQNGEQVVSTGRDGIVRLTNVASGAQRVIGRSDEQFMLTAVSPDSRWLAATGEKGAIYLWDLSSTPPGDGEPVQPHILAGQGRMVIAMHITDDGSRLFARYGSGKATIWTLRPAPSDNPTDEISIDEAVALNSDGSRLVRSVAKRQYAMIDMATQKELWRIQLPGYIKALRFSPDNELLAVMDSNKTLHLIDSRTGESAELGQAWPIDWPWVLAFSPRGRWLAAPGEDWSIQVWDLSSRRLRVLRGHTNALFSIAFTRDETSLVSASDDGTARVWDLESRNVRVLRGHSDDVFTAAVSPSGKMVATGSFDSTVRIWPLELDHATRLSGHHHEPMSATFVGPDAVVSAGRSGEIRRWHVSQTDSELIAHGDHSSMAGKAVASTDGRYLSWLNRETGQIEVRDANTAARIELPGFTGPKAWLKRMVISSGGTAAAALAKDGTITTWQLDPARRIGVIRRPEVCDLAISPDGGQVAIVTPSSVELWYVEGHAIRAEIERPGDQPSCGEFSRPAALFAPNGQWLAVSGAQRGLLMWNTRTAEVLQYGAARQKIQCMAFAPDSSVLAASLSDRSVRLWSPGSKELKRLGRHGDAIGDVAFSPDGKTLATGSYDQTVRLWDVARGDMRVLLGHSQSVTDVAFSSDSRFLVSASRDHTVRVWNIRDSVIADAAVLRTKLDPATTAVIRSGRRLHTPR
ncbi:MAG: serine/threonine protein kinase [Proteobacteria bacterium]|nr:serine/threonine protein kinase [Pseudomonadota bacterium]